MEGIMPTCCGQQMEKLKDTTTQNNRYRCKVCGSKRYHNTIENLAINISLKQDRELSMFANNNILEYLNPVYIRKLRYTYKKLIITPDEELTNQKRSRKKSVIEILNYWEIKKGGKNGKNKKRNRKSKEGKPLHY